MLGWRCRYKGPFAGYGCDQGIVWTFYYGNGT